jgi:hypothetical protein
MIKDTPDELGIPSFDIEAANVMCEIATNPGISHREMFKLALVITRDHFDKPVSVRSRLLENEAKRFLSKKETDRIEATTQEATHKIIDGAHLFQGYDAPEKPDYFPGA